MKKFASKQGSQLILKDDGSYTFKMSKQEWRRIGKEAGWMKKQSALAWFDGNKMIAEVELTRNDIKPEILPLFDKASQGLDNEDFSYLETVATIEAHWERGSSGGQYEPPTPSGWTDVSIVNIDPDFVSFAGIKDLEPHLTEEAKKSIIESVYESDAPEDNSGPDPDYLRDQMMDDREMDREMNRRGY